MNRFVKIALIVVGSLIALIVIAVIVLPLIVDANDFKGPIVSAAESQTGRDIRIDGDLHLSVFPWLGVRIGQAQMGNAKGFGDQPFASIKSAQVSVKLLPLLHKNIEIGTVSLDGLRLRLAKKADGTSNWDDLVKRFSDTENKPKPQPKPTEKDGFSMSNVQVGSVEISDAAIAYSDAQSGESYKLHDVDASTGRLVLGQAFPVNLSFAFDADKLGIASKTSLVAKIQPNLDSQQYRFSNLKLNVNASGKAVPGGEQQLTVTGHGDLDMQAGRLKVSDLMVQGAGLNVTGQVDGSHLSKGTPAFDGRVTIKQFNPRTVMKNLGMQPPATSDSDALTSAGLDTRFAGTANSATLKQLVVKLDNSTLKGNAEVNDFSKPDIGFKLALDKMNVDHYLPPASKASQSKPAATSGSSQSTQISVAPLKNLKLDGQLTAGDLTVNNLKLQDAELAVSARNGKLQIQPLGANLYNGSLRMQSTVDAATKEPTYAVKGNLAGVKLGALLKDLVGTDKVAALADMNLDFTTRGNTVKQLERSLNGTAAFKLHDGLFNGFDLTRILTIARDRLLGKPTGDTGTGGKTAFSKFAAAFMVTNGVFKGGDMNLNTPVAQLGGAGSYNLPDDKLDYTVNAHIPKGADSKVLKRLAGYTIPIKLSGALFSPHYSLDLSGALKSVAEQKLQEQKSKLQDKLDEKMQKQKQKLGNKIQKGLNNFFNHGNKNPDNNDGSDSK